MSAAEHVAWQNLKKKIDSKQHRVSGELEAMRAEHVFDLPRTEDNHLTEASINDLVQFDVKSARLLLARLFKGACEIWDELGQRRSDEFYNAVWKEILEPQFNARHRQAMHRLRKWASRRHEPLPSSGFGFTIAMMQLKHEFESRALSGDTDFEPIDLGVQSPPANEQTSQNVTVGEPRTSDSRRVLRRPAKSLKGMALKRATIIVSACKSNLKGRKYCLQLDHRGLSTPQEWSELGAPSKYAEAYENPKWRKRIQDEKSRIYSKYKDMKGT